MRRCAAWPTSKNRVFEKYARAHRLPFIDLAAEFPQDPALGSDAIHFTYPGLALEAWIVLQHLIPIVEERLADGRLPKPPRVARTVHPAFERPSTHTIALDTLQVGCRQPSAASR